MLRFTVFAIIFSASSPVLLSILTLPWQISGFFDWNQHHFKELTGALLLSIKLSLKCSLISVVLSIYFVWIFNLFYQKLIFLFLMLLLFFASSDVVALSLIEIWNYFGVKTSQDSQIIFAQVIYILPYTTVIIYMTKKYTQDDIITAFKDCNSGLVRTFLCGYIVRVKRLLISAFLLGFLLVFNEYRRTSYLSGADKYLSEYIEGSVASTSSDDGLLISSLSSLVILLSLFLYRSLPSKNVNNL